MLINKRKFAFFLQRKLVPRFYPWMFVLYVLTLVVLIRKANQSFSITLTTYLMESEFNPAPEPAIQWKFEDSLQNSAWTFRNITILMWTEYYHNKDLTDHVKNESPIPEWCNVTFERSRRKER